MTTATPHPGSIALHAKYDIAVELYVPDGQPKAITAKMHRVIAGLVELSCPVYLREDQELEMVCQGCRILARVAHCKKKASGVYDVAIRIGHDAQKRKEERVPANLPTKLYILSSPATMDARAIDLSPSGVGIEVPDAIPVGARVSLFVGYSTALGEIRHCTSRDQKYRAGIRLEKLIRYKDQNAQLWAELNSGSENTVALAAFEGAIEERHLRSEALLLSLLNPVPQEPPSN